MTTRDLITHLEALIAANPSVADLPVYAYEAQVDYVPITSTDIRVRAELGWRYDTGLTIGG